jgi:hypothetical protein
MGIREAVTTWTNWRDVFASEVVRTDLTYKQSHAHTWMARGIGDKRPTPMHLSTFCTLKQPGERRIHLDVVPTAEAIAMVSANTIHVSWDTMSWEVIVWDDGRALVVCSHSSIIGSVWIAKIDASTIPAFPNEEE